MEDLVPKVYSEAGKRLYADIDRTHDAYRAVVDREIQFRREGKTKEALEVMSTQAAPASAALENAISAFEDHLTKSKQQVDKVQDDDVARGKLLILTFCLAGVALGFVAHRIDRSLRNRIDFPHAGLDSGDREQKPHHRRYEDHQRG